MAKKRVIAREEMAHLDLKGLNRLEKNLQPHERTVGTLNNIAKERSLRNPLTGQVANSYTQATNRTLPAPVNVQAPVADPQEVAVNRRHMARSRRQRSAEANMGYRLDDGIAEQYQTFISGRRHMFPNGGAARGNPAINEPHEADPGQRVARRAEDLSMREYTKGEDLLRQYGYSKANPTGDLRRQQQRALSRVTSEHIAAGVDQSSSQMFYGGEPTSQPQMPEDLRQHHETEIMASHDRFQQAVGAIRSHPAFREATAQMPERNRWDAATRLAAVSVAETSPRAKWRTGSETHPWPNIEQAEESAQAGLDSREPKVITGFSENARSAAARVSNAVAENDYDTHHDPVGPKRGAFEGAMIDKDNTDAFKTSDVHEASAMAPHLPPQKAHRYNTEDGPKFFHADQKVPEGATPIYETSPSGHQKISEGLSKPEELLARGVSKKKGEMGVGITHALNDRATREVLADAGLSRSVNHTDNTHVAQAAIWGSQQRQRGFTTWADQYPVTRRPEEEGVPLEGLPENHPFHSLFTTPKGLDTQWARTKPGESAYPEERLMQKYRAERGD